jgi:hypothetical protein
MIGIPILDSLSEEDLCLVASGQKTVKVIEPRSHDIQTKPRMRITKKSLQPNYKLMDNAKVIILCKMEIEHRLALTYFQEQMDHD